MGEAGMALCLAAGADDMGGTLMNESITRAAGGANGQEMDADRMQLVARRAGRRAWQRTTLYGRADHRPIIDGEPIQTPHHGLIEQGFLMNEPAGASS
jgi:FO synthase